MRKSTKYRRFLEPGDRVCFYAAKRVGVVASATITGNADVEVSEGEWAEGTPWREGIYELPLKDVIWIDPPVKLDVQLRGELDAFQDPSTRAKWGVKVKAPEPVTAHDFALLTGQES